MAAPGAAEHPVQPLSSTPRSAGADARTAWLLVAGQFVLLALIVLLGGGDDWSVPAWLDAAGSVAMAVGLVVMVVAAVGLGRGLTAAPLPNAHAQLRTGGLYRFVRHPIYSGLLLFVAAHTVVSGSAVQLALAVLLTTLIMVKTRWEERRLAERFPDYIAYASRTPRFVPFGRLWRN